jgi:hypothetical protein
MTDAPNACPDAEIAAAITQWSEHTSPRYLLRNDPELHQQWRDDEDTLARWQQSFANMFMAQTVYELSEAIHRHDALHDQGIRALLSTMEIRRMMIRKMEMDVCPVVRVEKP